MKISTSEESTFNRLAEIEAELYRIFDQAFIDGQSALMAHLNASITQIQITKGAALEAAGKPVEVKRQ